MSLTESAYSNSSSEGENDTNKVAKCIRRVANISSVKPTMLMDTKVFNIELLKKVIPNGAPKIVKLFDKIQELDAKDMRIHKRHFKHMIFTDIDSSNYGGKLLASAFVAYGFTPAFTNALHLKDEETLLQTKGNNFGLLLSKTFGKKSMNVKFKKEQMMRFNKRPDNVEGDLIRFMLLDQGFKEGIDLFDVKYVHLFEPLVSRADEKQAIGRSTRFCGQKGLEFHPRFGWPLYVFRYDVTFMKPINDAKTLFELYLKYSDIDMRRVVFAAELEKATIGAAVDTQLTEEIHSFKIDDPPPVLTPKKHSLLGGATTRSKTAPPSPPKTLLGKAALQSYVKQYFSKFKYPHVKLENMCDDKGAPQPKGSKVSFTPTQDFVRHFFQPSSAYKGILFFHSVGTGKTCSAIATATTSFEKEGYSILWVTRHTLKSDIWKNMYDQVCSIDIQERIDQGKLKLPSKIDGPMKYVSKKWIEPISYKQFSNMLLKENKYYEEIVARNGEKDPLRKTLVIIDEAHKLYAPNVVGSEKPQTDILEEMIQNSYKVSGKDSVRVILMTATPYTADGIEMLKLLNLLRPSSRAIPTEFEDFASKYLDEYGYFTKQGLTKFQDSVSGYVSYINRSQDARYFAHPVIENVYVDITLSGKEEPSKHHDKKIKENAEKLKELRAKAKEEGAIVKEATKAARKECQLDQKARLSECKEKAKEDFKEGSETAKLTKQAALSDCKELPVKDRKACKDAANDEYKEELDKLKLQKATALEDCNNLKAECAAEKGAKLSEIQKTINDLKDLMKKEKEDRDNTKGILKEFRENNKEVNTNLKPLRANAKALRLERKGLIEEIKSLKADFKSEKDSKVKTSIDNKIKPLVAKKKHLDSALVELRAKVTNLTSNKKLARINIGRGVIGDVSQEKVLYEKCLKDV